MKKLSLILFIYGIANFLFFAYDIQNDRDFFTWMWLLSSQISFAGSLMAWLKIIINEKNII